MFGNKNSGNIITSELLDEFETFKDLFNSSSMSAEALAESLGGVDDRILNYAKTCKNGEMTTQGFKTSLEGMTLSAKAGQVVLKGLAIAGNMLAFWAISEGIQLVAKGIKGLNDDYEKLENKISKLESTYDEQTQSIDDINSKLEENKQKINEILKLENPTYVDLQDLENLRTQNALLKENLVLKEKSKEATNKQILDSLDEELEKDFFTNDAKLENATRLDSVEDYVKNIFTLGGYNIYQSQKYYDDDTEYEKIKKSIEALIELNELKEELSNNGNSTITKPMSLGIGTMAIDVPLTIEGIENNINYNKEKLESYRTYILSLLDKRMVYDPNNESTNSKFLLSIIDQITKLLDFDTFTTSTIDKAIADNRFNKIGEKIKDSINSGIINNEEDLLSDEDAKRLIKYISYTLYDGVTNDDSLKKTASYIIKYFAGELDSGIEIDTPIPFLEAFNSADFEESKEKLLALAASGELTPKTLSSTEDYKKLIDDTGLSAKYCCERINDLVTAQEKLANIKNELSSITDLYKQANENGYVDINDISKLGDAWKNLNSYEEFVNIVGSGTHSMAEMQDAFNKLTSEYLNHNNALNKLDESNKDLYINQLKIAGISNAQVVVEKKLANQYISTMSTYEGLTQANKDLYVEKLKSKNISNAEEIIQKALEIEYIAQTDALNGLTEANKEEYKAKLEANGVTNASIIVENKLRAEKQAEETVVNSLNMTMDEFNVKSFEVQKSLLDEANASTLCCNEIISLQLAEINYNKQGLDASGKINQLKDLAIAYGIANTKAQEMADREQQMREYEAKTGAITGFKYTETDWKLAEEDLRKQIEASFAGLGDYTTPVNFNGDSDYQKKKDDEKEKSNKVFDWIETRVSRLQRSFQNMVDSVTKYVSKNFKLDSIDKQIASLNDQISTYQAGAEKYLEKANSVVIDGDLKHKVINGDISIQELDDETKINAVNEFKEWYEKYLDAIDKVAQLENDKREKQREKINAKTYALQQTRERLSYKADKKESNIDYRESLGKNANVNDYKWLINNSNGQYSLLDAENKILKNYLSTLDKTSEEWAEIQGMIESNESTMRDLVSKQSEWNKKIAQMPIEKAEKTVEKLSTRESFLNAKYENATSSSQKINLNNKLASNKKDELNAYRTSYNTANKNFKSTASTINKFNPKNDLVAKVQKYTKSGKEIPASVLSVVYNSGNDTLINSCTLYNEQYLALETARDTYKLKKETIKSDYAEIGQRNVQSIQDSYANRYNRTNNKKNLLNAQRDKDEAYGKYTSTSYYNQMIAQVKKDIANKKKEKKGIEDVIQKNLNDGLWTKDSQEYKDATSDVKGLETEIAELSKEQKNYNKELANMPIERLEKALEKLDNIANRNSAKNRLKKAQGKDLSEADYMKEINDNEKKINKSVELRKKYWGKYLDAKKNGKQADADKYFNLYMEEDTAVQNLKISNEELKDTMRDDVYWRPFERAHEKAQRLQDTLSGIIDLYSDEMLFNDDGSMTDIGVSKLALLIKNRETSQTDVNNYTKDLKNLEELYAKGEYTKEEYEEKRAEITQNWLKAAQTFKSTNEAIVDMAINQSEIELEAINKVIDKRKEALDAKKKYYDYDKNIKDKTKDIQSLQAQAAALSGVDTAEAKAQLARINSDLQKAKDDLEETKFDHKVELILEGFDSLKENLQETHDEYVKKIKSSYELQGEIIDNANVKMKEGFDGIIQTLVSFMNNNGMNVSAKDVKSLAGFADGGIVRKVKKNGDSALVSVNPDETILTKKFTDLLPYSVQAMNNFTNLAIPNMENLVKRNNAPVVNLHYDNLLNVNGNVVDMKKATMDVVKNQMDTISQGVVKSLGTSWRLLGYK